MRQIILKNSEPSTSSFDFQEDQEHDISELEKLLEETNSLIHAGARGNGAVRCHLAPGSRQKGRPGKAAGSFRTGDGKLVPLPAPGSLAARMSGKPNTGESSRKDGLAARMAAKSSAGVSEDEGATRRGSLAARMTASFDKGR